MTYKEIIVESVRYSGGGTSSTIRVKPLPGQGFPEDAFVACSKDMRVRHPIGTKFQIRAKVTTREGGTPFLYSNFLWPYKVVNDCEAKSFIAENFAD